MPIYLVAVGLSIGTALILAAPCPSSQIVGHIVFLQSLQGFIVPCFSTNAALWSLSYEAFFYILFAATIGQFQKQLLACWATLGLAAAVICDLSTDIGEWYGSHFIMIVAYSPVWLLGYCLPSAARYVHIGRYAAFACIGMLPMASRLSIFEAYYSPLKHLLVAATLAPMLIYLLEGTTGKGNREDRFSLTWAMIMIAYLLLAAGTTINDSLLLSKGVYILMPLASLVLASIIHNARFRFTSSTAALGLTLGEVSYALYATHMPILFLANEFAPTLSAKIGVVIVGSAMVAGILEYGFQPMIVRLSRHKAPQSEARCMAETQ